MSTWTAVLDAFEARLDEVGRALADGEPGTVPPFAPPADPPPIPADVVPRAVALLQRSREMEQLIAQARVAVRARLDAPPPAPRAPGQASRFDMAV